MTPLPHTLLVLLLVSTSNARLFKRATPSTLYIPVTVDENRVYSVNVNMSSGQPQSFSFAISTSTGYTVVAGPSCPSCNNVKPYNQSASSSAHSDPGVQGIVSSWGSSANGSVIREDCKLAEVNGSAWSYPNQTIVVANSSQGVFTPGVSGIFGLGTNSRDGNFEDTVFGGFKRRNPSASNFTYGMALNPPLEGRTDGGQLHWMAPDTSAYTGDVTWRKLSPSSASPNTSSLNADWFVEMDGFSFTSNSITVSKGGGSLLTVLDPFFIGVAFPQAQVRAIYGNVAGASITAQSDLTNVYSLPCDTKMSLTLIFGELSQTFDESVLIRQQNGKCLGIIEEWLSPSDTQYLLGSSVISQLYVIFTIADADNGALGLAQRASADKKFQTIAIVGITVGSVAFVGFLVLAGIMLYRCRRRRLRQQVKQKTEHIHPFPSPREHTGLLNPSQNATPLSSPSFYAAQPSASPAQMAFTTPSSSHHGHVSGPSTIQLSSDSGADEEHPPPYIISQWPRTMPVVPMRSPPGDRKRREPPAF